MPLVFKYHPLLHAAESGRRSGDIQFLAPDVKRRGSAGAPYSGFAGERSRSRPFIGDVDGVYIYIELPRVYRVGVSVVWSRVRISGETWAHGGPIVLEF